MDINKDRVVFVEESGIWFGFRLEQSHKKKLIVRMDADTKLHRMPIAYDYFEKAMNAAREFSCEHNNQTFRARVSELLTVDKHNEILRLALTPLT
jgi:hypothetical protein